MKNKVYIPENFKALHFGPDGKPKKAYTAEEGNKIIVNLNKKCLVEGINTTLGLIESFKNTKIRPQSFVDLILWHLNNNLTLQKNIINLSNQPDIDKKELAKALKFYAKREGVPSIKI